MSEEELKSMKIAENIVVNPGLDTEQRYESEIATINMRFIEITPVNDMPQAPDEKAPETIKPDFEEMGRRIGLIVKEKDAAYGDSVRRSAKIMEILYPHGIGRGDYVFALLNLRIIDKLCRSSSDPWAFGENPYDDIGGYAVRGSEIANEVIENYRKILETVDKK